MAQIIKHRRGSLESISAATKRAGELLVVTGSTGITATNGNSLLFIGVDGSSATPANKILQGTSVPNLSGAGYDTSIDGIPFYDTAAQKLYILNKGGNVEIRATAQTGGTGIVSGSSQVNYTQLSGISANIISASTDSSTVDFTITGGSITANLIGGVVSGSSQVVGILSSLNTYTASNDTTNTTQNSRLDQLSTASGSAITRLTALEAETLNLELYTASNDTTNTTQTSRLNQLSTASGSAITRLNLLEVETANLEAFSGSTLTRLSTLEIETANLEAFSASALTRLSTLEVETANLEAFTSSINTTIKTRLNVETVISGSSQVQIGSVTGFTAFSSSVDSRLDVIEDSLGGAGSIGSRVSSLEAFTGSQQTRNNTLATYTASVDSRLSNLQSFTSSQQNLNATFATTGSNIFQGTQTITGSLFITQNLVVQGSSSLVNITGSSVNIGTNNIVLNTATPAVRFGGISVTDSGSGQGISGSLIWDSFNNNWLYVQPSGSGEGYNSAILIAGPKNTGTLGNESYITSGSIQVALGENHIGNSIMTQNVGSTKITVAGALDVNGAVSASSFVGIGNATEFSSSVDSRLDAVEASIGGGGSIGSRVTSLEAFTGSQQTRNNTLATYTASVDTRLNQLSTDSGSQAGRLTSLEAFSGSQQTKDNTLATYTASVDTRLNQLSTASGSAITRLTALEAFSSSLDAGFVTQVELASATGALETVNTAQSARLTSLESFSGSQQTRNATLATYTASVDTRLNQLSTDSGSQATRLSSIEGFTSSIDNTIKTKLNVDAVVSSSAQVVTLLSNQATNFGTGRVSANNIGNLAGTTTFTGSFVGNGSQLTGLVTDLRISGSTGNDTLALLSDVLLVTGSNSLSAAVTNNTITITAANASTSTRGVASFDADDFSVTTGNVSIKANGVRAVNLNSDLAGIGLSLNGVDNSLQVDYGSTSGTAVEGNTALTIQGTTNEIEITGGSVTLGSGGTVTIGLPNSVTIPTASIQNNLSVGGSVTITGNLFVQGSTTTIDSTTIQLGDNIIELNGSYAANGGLLVKDVTNPNTVSGSLLWNPTVDHWMGGALGSEKQFARFNSTPTSGSVQVIGANGLLVNSTITDNGVDVSITGDLTIGGLSANSFIVANSTKELTAVAAVNTGDLIIWNGSSFVASNTIDGGTF